MDTFSTASEPAACKPINRAEKTLAPAKSICPCHPAEVRSERFAVLDSLIKAGRGSVPLDIIELEYKHNGGVLPAEVPSIYLIFDHHGFEQS